MGVIWINKHCIYCRPIQHSSFRAAVHNRIEYKINFHLAHINMGLNIYSLNIFSKYTVCSFTPLNFQNECVPCSLLQQQQLCWRIYQLLPWLELTLWYILNCMQPHREKSKGFSLVDQIPVYIRYYFSDIWPTISARCRGVLPFYVQICHLVARGKCLKLFLLFYEKFL